MWVWVQKEAIYLDDFSIGRIIEDTALMLYLKFFILFFFFGILLDRLSVCTPGCSQTICVFQTGIRLIIFLP